MDYHPRASFQEASMKFLAAVLCFLLLGSFPVHAQSASPRQQPAAAPSAAQQPAAPAPAASSPKIDPAKEADIRRLLEVTGAKGLAMQSMTQMEEAMRPLMTNAFPPGDYRDRLIDLFFKKFQEKVDPQIFVNMAVPLYAQYFTDDEIKGLIQFDQTPLGRKLLSVLPKLQLELQKSARGWGQNIGKECMREVLAEHPELVKELQDAAKAAEHP
jgi:hypothetical protein